VSTLTYTGQLVVTSCWCGIRLAVPDDLYRVAKRHKGRRIYCPLGHEFIYGDTTDEQLAAARQDSQLLRKRLGATHDLLRQEERSHIATRGHVTRKKKELARVKAGVCPCCRRSFQNLARHMAGQHPEFKP